jgi:putative DNA primase/helicase
MDLVEHALHYAGRGWFIFPLRPRSKMPLIPAKAGGRGFHDATTDQAQILKWWEACPGANIGLATGASGLVVIDVDGPEGLKELEAGAKKYGGESAWPMPRTLVSRTGREGGMHLFYRGTGIPSSQVKGSHVDVRGSTGYVVLPPSIHPSGAVYEWVVWQ